MGDEKADQLGLVSLQKWLKNSVLEKYCLTALTVMDHAYFSLFEKWCYKNISSRASSGAGAVDHFSKVCAKTNASAALAVSIFHRKEMKKETGGASFLKSFYEGFSMCSMRSCSFKMQLTLSELGAAMPPDTDALGQLLFEYSKCDYTSQLQHLKDIAGMLATEEAEDVAQVTSCVQFLHLLTTQEKKVSPIALVYQDTWRQQVSGGKLQEITEVAKSFAIGKKVLAVLLVHTPAGLGAALPPNTDALRQCLYSSTAVLGALDALLASLNSLDGILKQIKDITGQDNVVALSSSKKRTILASLDLLTQRMPSLLEIDHPCAETQIADALCMFEERLKKEREEKEHKQKERPSYHYAIILCHRELNPFCTMDFCSRC
ncbi:hypothetical protein K1719_001882 [Acacia pycnantha]|nr:hypothetical protein K1719_001882 [Acacia pycnantha]